MIKPLGRVAVLTLAVLALMGWLWLEPARADSLNFLVDYGYNTSSSETREKTGAGVVTQNDSDSFTQEYRLFFDKIIYPYLTLRGGGSFLRTESNTETVSTDPSRDNVGDSTNIQKNPFVDLVLGSPMITGGLGVNRFQREDWSSSSEPSMSTTDRYTASLGWKPLDLPSFNLRTTHLETYNDPMTMNTEMDQIQFSSRYQPHETTEFSYSANIDRGKDLMNKTQAKSINQSGRASYADRFFNNRVNFSNTYSVSHQTNEFESEGGASSSTLLIPANNLSSYAYPSNQTDLPVLTFGIPPNTPDDFLDTANYFTISILSPNGPTLVMDGNPKTSPLQIVMGFDKNEKIQVVRLRLNHDLKNNTLAAVNFFWKVSGWDGSAWHTITAAPLVTLGTDFTNLINTPSKTNTPARYFELTFPNEIQYDHIKVEATPLNITALGYLPAELDGSNITITNVVAGTYLSSANVVAGQKTKMASTSHMYNMATRVKMLENPGLDYNVSLFYRLSDPGSNYRLFVSNGPTLYHRLSPWLTGNAMFARDDSMKTGQQDKDQTYRYGAGLTAQPLPTLNSNLNYSGRKSQQPGQQAGQTQQMEQNSFAMNNRAALYPGLDMLFGGGLSFASQQPGDLQSETSQVNMGMNIVPHRTMSWNLIGFLNRTSTSGGGRPDSLSNERRGQISVSYSPVSAVSIYAASDVVIRDTDTRTLQNYGLSWSPFRDGTLQVGFSYYETEGVSKYEVVRPEEKALDRVISPNLTWQIRPGTYLDLNYAMINSSTINQEAESISFNARLRAMF